MSLIVDRLRECRSIDRLVPKSWRLPGLPQTAAVDPQRPFASIDSNASPWPILVISPRQPIGLSRVERWPLPVLIGGIRAADLYPMAKLTERIRAIAS
jgi:hypothetical protein